MTNIYSEADKSELLQLLESKEKVILTLTRSCDDLRNYNTKLWKDVQRQKLELAVLRETNSNYVATFKKLKSHAEGIYGEVADYE